MEISVHNKTFRPFISSEAIAARVREMGAAITRDYRDLNPLCLAVLNGAFVFAADLFRVINTPAEICFVRLSSYEGMTSTGQVVTAAGPDKDIRGRHVLILEDIIDTGATLDHFLPVIHKQQPASVKTAALLMKTGVQQHGIHADYTGFEIPDRFVVGYGLDYNGLGRNLPALYQLT